MMETNLLINYLVMFFCGAGFFVIMLKSFLPAWLSVRMSGGSKVLVHIKNPLMDYFRAGKVDNGFLYYTARKRRDNPKPARMLYSGDIANFTYKVYGVNCVDVDDEKNCIITYRNQSYTSVSTNNAEAYDEAQFTALNKPSKYRQLFDTYTWQLIVLFIAFIVCAGIVIVYQKVGTVDSHAKLIYDTLQIYINSTMVPP